MARIPAAFFLALAFSQVLAVIEVDYIENVIEQKRKDVGSTPGSRILSGWEASPGQLPHQVGLRQVDRAGGVTGCGGSVLHHAWVLTAAHCTGQSVTIVIRAGVTHMTTPQYLGESTEYYNFPTFDSSRPHIVQPNDVAMIKLRTPVVFTELLQRVRVQPSADAYRNYEGLVAVASGFGRLWTNGASPETLNWVHLRMVSNQNCAATFGSIITSTSICARYYNVSSQSVCQGDSGGPLVYTSDDGVPTLIGVTSFVAGGEFGCHSGLPAGFARPGPFLAWFQEITGIDFENLDEDEEPTTTTTEEPKTTTTEEPTTTTTEEPTTTTTTEEPTTTTSTEKPITQPPEPESEEDKEVDNNSGEDSDSDSSSEEDDEMKDLLKRMEVLVKVKVRMNKLKKKHVIHEKH